jgi:pimeloyl-ACP methyl ester carboxylesterase
MDRQQRTVTSADGVALAVRAYARPGAATHAPTVVLAHDWGLTQASWEAVVAGLAPSGLRVITWDQRGHGGSALGLNRGALDDLTIDHFGRDLHALIRALVPPSSPVILVGHSLGGMTALSYLGHHEQEARTRVAGAVLVSTAAVDVRLGQQPTRATFARRLTGAGRDFEEPLVRGGNHRAVLFGDSPDPAALAAVREQFKATDPAVLRASYRAFCRADVRRGLEILVRLPVSIVVGAQDVVTPPARSRAMTMTLTQARYVTVREAAHQIPYEAPDRIVGELRHVVSTLSARIRAAAAARRGGGPEAPPSGTAPLSG